jgi:hypothetical protein
MATTTQEAPEGERLARIEATLDALIREVSDVKAEIRDIRTSISRNLLSTLGVMIAMWVTVILTVLFRT